MWDVQSALGFRVSVLRDSGSLSLSLCLAGALSCTFSYFFQFGDTYCSILYTCTFVRL